MAAPAGGMFIVLLFKPFLSVNNLRNFRLMFQVADVLPARISETEGFAGL